MIRKLTERFGKFFHIGSVALVSIFVFFQAIDVYDAVRYPYMFFMLLAFVAGSLLLSNRWVVKVVSVVALFVVCLIAGNEVDVKQVFVYTPYLLGVASQFIVGLRINLLDKGSETTHREDH